MQVKKWEILRADTDEVISLHQSLGIHQSLCKILVLRNIRSYIEAKNFFRPTLASLHDPFLIKDMENAVARILLAIKSNEKILVYGDYDVDGTTSVSLVYQALSGITDKSALSYYIPHRQREGYGVSKAGIDYAIANKFSLIICLDCGIKSVELIQLAKENGVDFIVCDHHLPGEKLPPAIAILNVKQEGCQYPYKELSGCGVGFKLISALYKTIGEEEQKAFHFLPLVVTSIAADIVPITGENRVLSIFGLAAINTDPLPGLKALFTLASVTAPVSISNLVFAIAPRINAAGRMDDANKVVKLLICEDEAGALELAGALHSDNALRKDVDVAMTEMALDIIKSEPSHATKKSTVLYHTHWHKGVVGIVASRVIENFYKPTILLTLSNGLATGSARSVHNFNVYEAIYSCREFLTSFGGHFAAAGLSMLPESVPAFTEKFETIVAATIKEDSLLPKIFIDTEIAFADITPTLYNIIKQMEPFGPENMRPVFISKNVTDKGYSRIVKENHIRFVVSQEDCTMTGIGFNMSEKFPFVATGAIDIVYTIDENEWNGSTTLQLKVIDIRKAEINNEKIKTA